MTPIEFPQQTMVWAKNQPPYLPLPAYVDKEQTITCWRLTWRERMQMFLFGRLWLRQLNFSQALQPQAPSVQSPFLDPPTERWYSVRRRLDNMAKKWMAKAFGKNPGALHRSLGVPEGKKIPAGKLAKAEHSSSPLMRKRAALAETGKRFGGKGRGRRGR